MITWDTRVVKLYACALTRRISIIVGLMFSEKHIRILLQRCEEALGVPLTSLRHSLRRDKNWIAFLWELILLDATVREFDQVEYEPDEAMPDIVIRQPDFSIEATTVNPTNPPEKSSQKSIRNHPFYRKLKKKAQDLKKKRSDKIRNCPAIIAIATTSSDPRFLNHANNARYGPEAAIHSALMEPSMLDPITRANLLGKTMRVGKKGWEPDPTSDRVAGSKYISAVLLVRIRNYQYSPTVEIFENLHAATPLQSELRDRLLRLDFGELKLVENLSVIEKNRRASVLERNLDRGGSVSITLDKECLTLEITAIALLQILAGENSTNDVLGEEMVRIIRIALEKNRELVEVHYEKGDGRDEPTVNLVFGPPMDSVIGQPKD